MILSIRSNCKAPCPTRQGRSPRRA
jgi:hypothetical protein